mmetsp:Transcript_18067/g.15790  ORF Transcript_18067/g.15790 Transcript_18067/m.15790 type:complete len:115 (-) Transcript_18067:255-599(-)
MKKWRKLSKERKMSLQNTAKYINVSKKTLESYLKDLKQGLQISFKFEDHLDEKIGYLRSIIKNTIGSKMKKRTLRYKKEETFKLEKFLEKVKVSNESEELPTGVLRKTIKKELK